LGAINSRHLITRSEFDDYSAAAHIVGQKRIRCDRDGTHLPFNKTYECLFDIDTLTNLLHDNFFAKRLGGLHCLSGPLFKKSTIRERSKVANNFCLWNKFQ